MEILQRQTDGIQDAMALHAARLFAVLFEPHPYRLWLLTRFLIQIGCDIWRRRRWRRAHQLIEHPRSTQNGRRAVAIRSTQQYRALAQQAPALFVGERDPTELSANDTGNAVVTCQPLVQERVVGGQQFYDAPIFQKNAAQELFRLF